MTIERRISLFDITLQRRDMRPGEENTFRVRQRGQDPKRRVEVTTNDEVRVYGINAVRGSDEFLNYFVGNHINRTFLLRTGTIWKREYRYKP